MDPGDKHGMTWVAKTASQAQGKGHAAQELSNACVLLGLADPHHSARFGASRYSMQG
jgi:hypothetical protein